MNKINNINSNKIENSMDKIKKNFTSDFLFENKRKSKKYKSQKTTRKNKSTQLFETLLGSKLILTENSNMIIEKPFTIFEILDILKTSVELDVKMEIIEKLKMIILRHHINSAIIMEKSSLKDSKEEINILFFDELIKILLENSREPKLIEELLNLLGILIQNSGAKIEYFWNVFKRISQISERNKTNYDGTKFLLLHFLIVS